MKGKTKRQIVEEESQGGICSNFLLVAPVWGDEENVATELNVIHLTFTWTQNPSRSCNENIKTFSQSTYHEFEMEKLTQIDIFLLTRQEKVVQSYMMIYHLVEGRSSWSQSTQKSLKPSKWVQGKNHLACWPNFEESSMSSTWQVKWEPGTRLEFRWKEATKSVSLRRTWIFSRSAHQGASILAASAFWASM